MISIRLLLACLLWGGVALFIFEAIWYLLERKLRLPSKLPPELLEEDGFGYFISKFIMQFAFLVAMPAVVYSWFYVMVPFSGVRAGVSLALFVFMLGIIPFAVSLLMRIKLPLSYTLFQSAGHLIKLIIVFGVISYLYIL